MKFIFLFIAVCTTLISAKLTEEDQTWGKNYDDSMYFSKDYSQANSDSLDDNVDDISINNDDSERLDCFGLPGKLLRRFYKLPSNGTEALKFQVNLKTRGLSKRVAVYQGEKFSLNFRIDLAKYNFDIKKKNVFITHGWWSRSDEKWIEDMEYALLRWVRFKSHYY